MPETKKAREAGSMLCDQACKTLVYSVWDSIAKRKRVFNAMDDTDHICPTAQTARLFQYKFNMVYGNIIDKYLENAEQSIAALRAELNKEIQNNKNHAPEFDEWKQYNREGHKRRQT